MSVTFTRSAAGLALIAAVTAACGTAAAGHHAAPNPANAAHHHAATAPARPANAIPQGNGGDHDPDNSGGPSDGDGNI